MSQREENNYEVLHWYNSGVSDWALFPNLNRHVDPDDPRTEKKWELLNDKRFRKALSLAINRRDIIDAIYDGIGEPAQVAPDRDSYFYHEETADQAAVNFLSGMTDHYAIRLAEELKPGISRGVFDRVPLV